MLFLNILSFNSVQMPNKSFTFRKLRRSYVDHLLSFQPLSKLLYFFAWCALFKLSMFLFFNCLTLMILHLHNLFLWSTPAARMLLTPRWVSRCEIVIHIFISRRTTFSPNPHLVEETTCFPFFTPWYDLSWTA